jgi:hypothetical protein
MRRAHAAPSAVVMALVLASLGFGVSAAPVPALALAKARPQERSPFKPRIGFAMGIEPAAGTHEIAAGPSVPVVYHGGSVMRNVTIHTVFWAPGGYHFDGSPSPGVLGYEPMIKQFLGDAAHDSGTSTNLFSLLSQYGDSSGAGSYRISYDPAADSIDATDPYPSRRGQCASPFGVATCVTDLDLQQEIDRLIGAHAPGRRGLSNIWFVFLPPDVDECSNVGECATNAFLGYHSLANLGHGPTIYVAIPDPLVELTPSPGSDPEGNPEAESTIDTVAHETVEAITDPVGSAWMDPNGFETADKCEDAPTNGTPLGFASDGSPYNQLINGHEYLIQDIWSNTVGGCVQRSTTTDAPPPLHTIDLRQFSSRVSGSLGVARRVPVTVAMIRSGAAPVALGRTRSRADGSWGPVTLRSRDGAPHAVGDDRDRLEIFYGSSRSSPQPDLILTGDGGNPFTEGGYTGWFDLDNGYAVTADRVTLGPCSQTGVLSLRVGAAFTEPPAELCQTETDAAVLSASGLRPATRLTMSSEDNRGEYGLAPGGALVRLTVALGEPDSVSALGNAQLLFTPTGFPTCTAFLRVGSVRCSGLVPGAGYTIADRRARAGAEGVINVDGVALRGGQVLRLTNRAGHILTALHVAHLRVDITGEQTRIASGTCQPGDYYGPSITQPPISGAVGTGIAGSGTICPAGGRARGLSTADVAQTDDFSGGQTQTQVPFIASTAPINDETLYGGFDASAQSGLAGRNDSIVATGVPVALTITRAASRRRVFHAANVDTARGVSIPALTPGDYVATWVLRDANGDTRTATTRFVDEP